MCCSCCARQNINSLNKNTSNNFITNYNKNSELSNHKSAKLDTHQNDEVKNINGRGSIIVFNEKIQEFSYIDNDPISNVDKLSERTESSTKRKISVELLNTIETVNTINKNESNSKTTSALSDNDSNLKLDDEEKADLDENNNNVESNLDDLSSSPETVSSSEKSRELVRKKSFFKSKKIKLKKKQIDKDIELEPMYSNQTSTDVNSFKNNSICLNDFNSNETNNSSIENKLKQYSKRSGDDEKRRFSLRKSIFRPSRTKNKSNLSDQEIESEQIHLTNNTKPLNSLKTISDEYAEESDCTTTPTNTDSTSIRRSSINKINSFKLTSKRASIPLKSIFTKKDTKFDNNNKRCTIDGSILDNTDFSKLKITSQVFRV
jgi:hypothetical protein